MQDRRQGELFADAPPLPSGLAYAAALITTVEEQLLIEAVRRLPLHEARYKEYTAKRRVMSYGSAYDFEANERVAAPSMPEFLMAVRDQAARWAGVPPARFVHALVSEYRRGTALGWHRDVPDFDVIIGVSLGTPCRMRFRPFPPSTAGRHPSAASRPPSILQPFEIELEPRSVYVLRGPARWEWQHSIPPVDSPRYSITFRSLWARPRASAG